MTRNTLLIAAFLASAAAPATALGQAYEAQRGRARGIAHFENDDFEKAIKDFRTAFALSRDPRDRFNLGISMLMARRYTAARVELLGVSKSRYDDPAPHFAIGILEKRMRRLEPAIKHLEEALKRDPNDPATLYNHGVLLKMARKDNAGAAKSWEAVMKMGWTTGGHHFISALYRHSQILLSRAHEPGMDRKALLLQMREEKTLFQRYQAIVGSAAEEVELEEGRYMKPMDVPGPIPPVAGQGGKIATPRFVDSTKRAGLRPRAGGAGQPTAPGAPAVVACDVTGDGWPELIEYGNGPLRLWVNKKGRFRDGTEKAGLAPLAGADIRHVACADFDNDSVPGSPDRDLYITTGAKDHLLRNDKGRFVDITEKAGCAGDGAATAALWLDLDHDGDMDLYVLHGKGADGAAQKNLLCVNRGDGSFQAQAGIAGLTDGASDARAVAAFDHDGDSDVDLLVANASPWTMLFSSLREGRFEEVSRRLGLADDELRASAVSVADLDNDGRQDLILETAGGLRLLSNQGDRGFTQLKLAEGPARAIAIDARSSGRFDLVRFEGEAAELWVAVDGDERWSKALDLPAAGGRIGQVIEADVNRDGGADLVAATPSGLRLWLNKAKLGSHFVRIRLEGKRNNKTGVGATVEVRAGLLYANRLHAGGDLVIGYGSNSPVDAVRIHWPNGISQQVVAPRNGSDIVVAEVEGLAGSCPFLYVWDGDRMAFVTDILGSSPLGIPMARGKWIPPDPDERIFISGDLLKPRGGRLRLAITEELREETTYLDEAALYAVDHPVGTRIVPNERFSFPPHPEHRIFAFPEAAARPPIAATDTFGNDVLGLVRAEDGKMVGSFIANPDTYRGTVSPHTYTLDPGDLAGVDTVWLIATGWVHWGGGSASIAASQNPDVSFGPVRLDVVGEDGEWVVARPDIGFPAGKTKTMPVDLTGIFRHPTDFRLRIVTTLRLHWDAFLFVRDPGEVPVVETRANPATAELRWLGFPERIDDDPTLPERFVYDRLRPADRAPWNQMAGKLTRYGDVRELLAEPDDRMVIYSAGDEIALEFEESAYPPLAEGSRRDYLLYVEGWNKDGDFNNGQATTVEPLPFHGMSGYPYAATESYPDTEAHRAYRAKWNTRPGRQLLPDWRPPLK